MAQATTYLDHNATAPLRPEAREAMVAAMDALAGGGNPSSVHRAGRVARRLVEDARASVASLVSAVPDEIVFTSGGTEANSLAIMGTLASGAIERLIVVATEHASVIDTAAASGVDVKQLGVDSNGVANIGALVDDLQADARPALVCVMASNNETGAIQPVLQIMQCVIEAGGRVHVDAVQHVGKLPLSPLSGAHTMALSAHKIGGPQGVGALVVRGKGRVEPMLRGGGQELRRRAGTENVVGIAGFGAAADKAAENQAQLQALAPLRDELEVRALQIAEAVGHVGAVICPAVERLPNTSCIAFDGVKAETLLMALDLGGVCVSSGSACSSGKVARSHVLEAMGINESRAGGAIRVSMGWNTTDQDVERFCSALEQALKRIRPADAGHVSSDGHAARTAGE
ncbi:cysteine desulfurase family protein [Pyruvatibacter sp. HU-CL02332]|uniref:cysteine desulfurase family protein n=1 Tax=Pyruvatibacter sp. HU-CL02332 TaxID=3127650 RepID=UPI003101D9CB